MLWLSLVAGAGVAVAQPCQAPQPLLNLASALAGLPASGRSITPQGAQHFSATLRRTSEGAILKQLQANRLEALNGIAIDLLSQSARLTYAGAPYDARHLRAMVSEFHRQAMLACRRAGEVKPVALPGDVGGQFTEDRVDWEEVARILEENQTVAGGAVVVVMVAVIGVLFGADYTVRWVFALVYNRRACRVAAEILELGDAPIEGFVVTLGRGGFRFEPLDPARFEPSPELEKGLAAVLQVEGQGSYPATLSAAHGPVADFRLVEKLSLRTHANLLSGSTISPHYVRRGSRFGLPRAARRNAARDGPDAAPLEET